MVSQGRLIVITGPSGVGKGTLVRQLLERHRQLHLSVSVTTRPPRPGEIDGKHYYFVDRDRFEEMVQNGELLEWAEFAGNYYGTPLDPVKKRIEAGESVLLEIELIGARQIRERFPQAQLIFIHPPSMLELERRLRSRAQDSDEAIAKRLKRAAEEINAAKEFDLEVVNDNLDQAIKQLENVLFAVV
ncbi:guanylate kinase [Capilliphycus salinus ALCB114379]|uniref:guanylate kinase n=1 Tax=Capilliphycus salinus TaxID=2768948 RepID=UPI0039A4D1F2